MPTSDKIYLIWDLSMLMVLVHYYINYPPLNLGILINLISFKVDYLSEIVFGQAMQYMVFYGWESFLVSNHKNKC